MPLDVSILWHERNRHEPNRGQQPPCLFCVKAGRPASGLRAPGAGPGIPERQRGAAGHGAQRKQLHRGGQRALGAVPGRAERRAARCGGARAQSRALGGGQGSFGPEWRLRAVDRVGGVCRRHGRLDTCSRGSRADRQPGRGGGSRADREPGGCGGSRTDWRLSIGCGSGADRKPGSRGGSRSTGRRRSASRWRNDGNLRRSAVGIPGRGGTDWPARQVR